VILTGTITNPDGSYNHINPLEAGLAGRRRLGRVQAVP
jgi:hypothetical protein